MSISNLPTKYTSVFELARAVSGPNSAAFARLFDINLGHPRCKVSPALRDKYGVKEENTQSVLRVSNKVTLAQCWFNEARTKKPQTFAAEAASVSALDPTGGGGASCDFCNWQQLTAEDTWGRVEGPHAVSASNLFKYVSPAQGVILFKHHDPLQFNLEQLQDLVNVSHAWFQQAAADEAARDAAIGLPPRQLHPLLVWNCLPRGGASQFHSHAQVMLSDSLFPALQQEAEAVACYDLSQSTMSRAYYQDVLAAHHEVGLLLREGSEGDYAYCYPHLAPWKDMEVCIHGSSMSSPAFQRLLYTTLRALVDELGATAFNASIYHIRLSPGDGSSGGGGNGGSFLHPRGMDVPVIARVVSRGKLTTQASDFGGLEVFGGASIGHTDPFRVGEALRSIQATLPPAATSAAPSAGSSI